MLSELKNLVQFIVTEILYPILFQIYHTTNTGQSLLSSILQAVNILSNIALRLIRLQYTTHLLRLIKSLFRVTISKK